MSNHRWKVKSKIYTPAGNTMESEGFSVGENKNTAIRAHKEYLRDTLSCEIIDINVTSVVKSSR